MGGGGDSCAVDSATENRCSLVVGISSCSPTCVCQKGMCMYTHCICTWGDIKVGQVQLFFCISIYCLCNTNLRTYGGNGALDFCITLLLVEKFRPF